MIDNPGPGQIASRAAHPKPRKLSLRRKLAFAFLASCLFLGAVEAVLRVIGFRFLPATPEVAVNGQLVAPMFRHAPRVVWEPIPGVGPFNRDGFVGPTIPVGRVAGMVRVATVGDSCTQFGDPPYAELLGELLAERWGKPVELLNAGVAAYSTEQGLLRLQRHVLPYRPDVVTLYFGWNDHWMKNRVSDDEIAIEDARSWRWLDYMGWSRIVQGALCLAHMAHEHRNESLRRQGLVIRVPLERYRFNLRRMIELVRGVSAEPILVTAPTDIGPDTPPEIFFSQVDMARTGYATPKALHDAYVEATRQTAQEAGVRLADAALFFEDRSGLMEHDHIHLTQQGVSLMAELLAEEVTAALGD